MTLAREFVSSMSDVFNSLFQIEREPRIHNNDDLNKLKDIFDRIYAMDSWRGTLRFSASIKPKRL